MVISMCCVLVSLKTSASHLLVVTVEKRSQLCRARPFDCYVSFFFVSGRYRFDAASGYLPGTAGHGLGASASDNRSGCGIM